MSSSFWSSALSIEHKERPEGTSKEALLLDPGLCHISVFFDGPVSEIGEFMFF